MADKPTNPLVTFMDLVADAVDWIHDTFADPDLSRELRQDLGLGLGAEVQRPLPSGGSARMRLPNGEPVDVDKDAFDATVAEVKTIYQVLFDFFKQAELSTDEVWNVLTLVGTVGAAQSLQTRWPVASAVARAGGLLGGLGSGDDVEALNIAKAIDLLGGGSSVKSDTTDPHLLEGIRNWVAVVSAVLVTARGDRFPVRTRASYGFEPQPASTNPRSDAEASAAYTLNIFDDNVASGEGFKGHLSLTIIYLPGTGTGSTSTPFKLHLALGAGLGYTNGKFTANIEAPAGAAFLLTSPWNWDNTATAKIIRATAAYGRPDAKAITFGEVDGPHFLIDTVQVRLDLSDQAAARLEFKNVNASLAMKNTDTFISSLSQELKYSFDLALIYDKSGLRFEGGPTWKKKAAPAPPHDLAHTADQPAPGAIKTVSGGLEASVPSKTTQFGPFRNLNNHLAIGRSADGTARTSLEITTSVATRMGPFNLTIDRIGLAATLRAGGEDPNLGLVDLDFGFKPPSGIGVALNAKVIKGGGFLYYDADKGEYAGVLELNFKKVTLKVMGILNTRAPQPAGWSLLLLISAEFRKTPLQLGLGFNLTAVGGIIGLQHQASVEELRRALGTNVFDDVLFPEAPVKDAPRLISRLRTLFPVRPGALTIGPTAEINWGKPAVVTARIAIIAQIDGVFDSTEASLTRLTVLGTVRAAAPSKSINAPRLVELTADVLGDYDVESGLLAIDARLRDSKLCGVEFTGSLIVRVGMGSNPAFAIAAGGFHPAFTDLPPALPARIDRLGLTWKIGDSIRLTLQAYAAVTASSWQLGALFTVVAEIGPVDIDGALAFDAIAYDDGRFSVNIEGHVKIKWRGHTLMSVSLTMVLDRSATQVWHAAGSASFSVLWWDKTVHFENTWGDEKSLPPAPTVDAAAAVRAGLSDPGNWTAQLPQGSEALVTLAPQGANVPNTVFAHPLGTLTVTQRVAPLNLRLDHLDGAPVAPGTTVSIDAVRVGGSMASNTPTRQQFPRARFQALSESQRLSQRSFEAFPAGVSVTVPGVSNPSGTVTPFDFEPINLSPAGSAEPGIRGFPADHVLLHRLTGRAARSPLRRSARLGADSRQASVELRQPVVVIVDSRDLTTPTDLDPVTAESATLARQLLSSPNQRVVEKHEVVA